MWSNANIKSVAVAYYLSDPLIQEYVINIIQAMTNKDIDGKPIIQKAYMKVYDRTYSTSEKSKIAMILFNPKCADYKIIKINKYVSLPKFFRNCLDDIGFSHYYKRLLPYINQERKIIKKRKKDEK